MIFGTGNTILIIIGLVVLTALAFTIWIDTAMWRLRHARIVSAMAQALAGVTTDVELAQVITDRLPRLFATRRTAFYLADTSGQRLRLARHTADAGTPEREMTLSEFLSTDQDVTLLPSTFRIADDPVGWAVQMRLVSPEGRVLGIVLLGNKERNQSYSGDMQILANLVRWFSAVIANVERKRELMATLADVEDAVWGEIAGDLHDSGISALAVARLMVLQCKPSPVVIEALDRVISNLRNISNRQPYRAGPARGLSQAIQEMVEFQRQIGNVHISFDSTGTEAIDSVVPHFVVRELCFIAQEATLNAIKYANASRIEVRLVNFQNTLVIEVCDDGLGFEMQSAAHRSKARGIGIMQTRAQRIGATFDLSSCIGTGTQIRIALPLQQRLTNLESFVLGQAQ